MGGKFICCMVVLGSFVCGELKATDDAAKPLTPPEARKKVGEKVTVQMLVRSAKDRLEKRGEVYLDAELDFRDEKNFAVVITRTGATRLKESGISDLAGHFQDKTILATGEVKLVQDVPRIEIDSADMIQVVDPLPKGARRIARP